MQTEHDDVDGTFDRSVIAGLGRTLFEGFMPFPEQRSGP